MIFKNFFKGFKEGQKLFGETIAIIVNTLLLTIVYLIGIGLTSVIAKIFKKNFLELEPSSKIKTYWKDFNLTKKPMEEYYKQF